MAEPPEPPGPGPEDSPPGVPLNAPPGAPAAPPAPQDWHALHLWQVQMVRDVLVVGGIIGLLYLGYLLSVVTVPLLLALALAYLFEPLVRAITSRSRFWTRPRVAMGILVAGGVLVLAPAIIGVGFAVTQGALFARELAGNLRLLNTYVENGVRLARPPEDATDRQLAEWRRQMNAVRENLRETWVRTGDELIELRLRARDDDEANGQADAAPGAEPPPGPDDAAPAPPEPADADGEASPAEPDQREPDAADTPDGAPPPEKAPADEAGEPTAGDLVEGARELAHVDNVEALMAWTIGFVQRHAEAISRRVLGAGVSAFEAAIGTFVSIGTFLFTLFLTAFFFYFFCTGYGKVAEVWDEFIPERNRGRVFYLLGKMDRVISGFIRGRLVVCACLVVFFTIGYAAVGVPAPLIIGPIVGLLAIAPYVSLVGIPISIVMMWLDPPGGWRAEVWWILAGPIIVYTVGQMLDDYVLTPIIQGKATGMDVPTILFASLAGAALAGFYGLLLAVPVAACLKILIQEIFMPRLRAWAAGRAEDVLPIAKQ